MNKKITNPEMLSSGQWKKPLIIGVLALLIITVLVVLRSPDAVPASGEAIHARVAPTGTDNLFIGFTQLNAAKKGTSYTVADSVDVEVKYNVPADAKMTMVGFDVEYDSNLELVQVGGKYLISDSVSQFQSVAVDPAQSFLTGSHLSFLQTAGVGGQGKVVTFYLRLKDSAGVGQSYPVKIKNIVLKGLRNCQANGQCDDYEIYNNPAGFTSNIIAVPSCEDTDLDGYGRFGSDLRGCPKEGPQNGQTNFDCVDNDNDCQIYIEAARTFCTANKNKIKPDATEQCNGVDDDCVAGTREDALIGIPNQNTRGVCWGTQICRGTAGWKNSYEVTDASNTILFGTTPQSQLYANTELCDLYDNDCDGAVNEDLGITCGIGSRLVGDVPGNVYIDYDPAANGMPLIQPQAVDFNDIFLVEQISVLKEEESCGSDGQSPCLHDVGGIESWLCRNGVYYQNIPDQGMYKFSPQSEHLERVELTPMTVVNENC